MSDGQGLLPHSIHVFLVKGRAARSLALGSQLARLDSLQLTAIHALHDTYPWFTYEVADSAQHATAETPALNLSYEITSDPHSMVRNIAMGISPDAFLYTIRREALDAGDQRSLSHSAEIMKDLEGYLQPGPLLEALYKDIYKKLAGDITTYVIDTKTLLPPQTSIHQGIIIDYRGITGPAELSTHVNFLVNGIVNNILVAGQSHYQFGYVPSWHGPAGNTDKLDSLIKLSITATDSAGIVTFHLDFTSDFPLLYQVAVDRNPAKMGGELVRTFTILAKDLDSGNYSPLIFPMAKAMNKFYLLNIPPRN